MAYYSPAGGVDRRQVVHTETRRPWESVAISVIWFIVGVIEALLALRFLLALLGANASAGFTQIVYALSAPFMAPFEAVFGATRVNGSTFDWSILLAMLVWALIGWGLTALIRAITPRATAGTSESVEEVDQSPANGGPRPLA
jgi:uncharacterized protein YggT (Ycf19 family)